MRLIDKHGRIFGKISILDILAIGMLLFLILLTVLKLQKKDLISVASNEVNTKVEYTLLIEERKGFMDCIKEGDRIAEMKNWINAEVKSIEIVPIIENNLDEKGNFVKSENQLMERAIVIISGEIPYRGMAYKAGKQEIREGKEMLFESNYYRLPSRIIDLKVVE